MGATALGLTDVPEGDRSRLEHVLLNFLSNSVKFSPEESRVTVEVAVKVVNSLSPAADAVIGTSKRIQAAVVPLYH
jgi:signal transduction histidine kinase